MITIQEASKMTGLTRQAIYKQIEENRGLGPYFYKNENGVYEVSDERVLISQYVSNKPSIDFRGAAIRLGFENDPSKLMDILREKPELKKMFNKGENKREIAREDFYRYFMSEVRNFTKYPDLFDCYWGNFRVTSLRDNLKKIEEVVENRNNLVETYRIKNRSRRRPHRLFRCLDHTESYTVEGSRDALIISSPYCRYPEGDEVNNWFKLPDLYASSTYSFGFWYSDNKHLFKRR
jgi:hypothetical protein